MGNLHGSNNRKRRETYVGNEEEELGYNGRFSLDKSCEEKWKMCKK